MPRELPHPFAVYAVIAIAVLLALTVWTPSNINAAVTGLSQKESSLSATGMATLEEADAKCTAGCEMKGLGFTQGFCDVQCLEGETAYSNSNACLGTDYSTCCCGGNAIASDNEMKPYDDQCRAECNYAGYAKGICDVGVYYPGDFLLNSFACSETQYPKCICYNTASEPVAQTGTEDAYLQQADAGCKQECESQGLSYTTAVCDSGCLTNEDSYSSLSCAKTQYSKCCCGPKAEEKVEWKVCAIYDESIEDYVFYCSPTCSDSFDSGHTFQSEEQCKAAAEYVNSDRVSPSLIFVAYTPAETKKNCQKCGEGWSNVCDEKECLGLGKCYFGATGALNQYGQCYPCGKSCGDYNIRPVSDSVPPEKIYDFVNEHGTARSLGIYGSYQYDTPYAKSNCKNDPCGFKNCIWDNIKEICYKKGDYLKIVKCVDCKIDGRDCTRDECENTLGKAVNGGCFSENGGILFENILCHPCPKTCEGYVKGSSNGGYVDACKRDACKLGCKWVDPDGYGYVTANSGCFSKTGGVKA